MIFLHVTWTTKNRVDFLKDEKILKEIIEHIKLNAKRKGIMIDTINGAVDHIHVLILLSTSETIARTIKLIKGESSWWIRRNITGLEDFSWQVGFDARPVTLDLLDTVRNYINNQKEHHSDKQNTPLQKEASVNNP